MEWRLGLKDLGPADWAQLAELLETLDSAQGVSIAGCSPPRSVSLLRTLWDKTEEDWSVDDQNEEDFNKLLVTIQSL